MAFTRHQILFVDVCMNFVPSNVEALSGWAFEARSYKEVINAVSTSKCVHTSYTHVNDIQEAWTDIWHVSWTRLQFSKLHARKRPSQSDITKSRYRQTGDKWPIPPA